MYLQEFFIGDASGQKVVGSLATPNVSALPRTLFLTYSVTGLYDVELSYLLTGGSVGSKSSDVAETVRVINTSGAAINDLTIFIYTDFDLNNNPANDSGANTSHEVAITYQFSPQKSKTWGENKFGRKNR